MKQAPLILVSALVAAAALAGGCNRGTTAEVAAPVWHAPHGGSLVWLSDRRHALELVHDGQTGSLTAWLLDARDGQPLAPAGDSLDLLVNTSSGDGAGVPQALVMPRDAGAGCWSAKASWLACPGPLTGMIPVLKLDSQVHRDLTFAVTSSTAFQISFGDELKL